ncbi:MAG: DUF2478 domain-containing protein [Thermoleophilia bacterium]|nr:DUF2478 domain-containing protein [Thermoleophilia bacterium]
MNLAYIMAPGRGDADPVLRGLATELADRGLRCRGTVQINSGRADAGPCDMDVKVLPDGPVLRISRNLGPLARGCRLDPAALEAAAGLVSAGLVSAGLMSAGLVSAGLDDGADVLIVNKFGRHEAEGRGFRSVIAEALDLDIPVIVGVNVPNLPAFMAFAGGLAIRLPPDIRALGDWVARARPSSSRGVPQDFRTGPEPPSVCPSAAPPVKRARDASPGRESGSCRVPPTRQTHRA